MSRSRNLKPGFFKNDQLAECHPLARILYQGLWCEADRAGRLEDRPKRLKADCLPYDECDVESLLGQLQSRGFIVRYQVGEARYIAIPAFGKHQNPHVKEPASSIPAPTENQTSPVQAPDKNSSFPADSLLPLTDSPSPLPKEKKEATRGSRLPHDWKPDPELIAWARSERPDLAIDRECASFADYWHGVAGAKGVKLDWPATFRNWIRRANGAVQRKAENSAPSKARQKINNLQEFRNGLAQRRDSEGLSAVDLPLLGSPTDRRPD